MTINFKLALIIFFFYLLVVFSKTFSFKQEKLSYKIQSYKTHNHIYLDREYKNMKNNYYLKNTLIIKVPRHQTGSIRIRTNKPIIVLRATCEKNNNKNYSVWEKINVKIKIVGVSCIHNQLYKKKFNRGTFQLLVGGPIASDPIFIRVLNDNTKIKVIN